MLIGVLLVALQNIVCGVPLNPNLKYDVWTVEAKVEYSPNANQPAEINLCLPAVQRGFTQLDQSSINFGYGANYMTKNDARFIQWVKSSPQEKQTLYYRAEILKDNSNESSMTIPLVYDNIENEPYKSAMVEIADNAFEKSASPYSFASQIIFELNQHSKYSELLNQKYNRPDLLVKILNVKGIPARIITVLNLEDNANHQELENYVAVFDDTEYLVFDAITGNSGLAENQLIWNDNENLLLEVYGGRVTSLCFSTFKNTISGVKAAERKNDIKSSVDSNNFLFSLDCLPIETQTLLKNMMILPIGVLVAIVLSVIVGVKTFGTFMPVLIALTFMHISPVLGIIGFLLVVGIGLGVRKIFSCFDLLLMGRISATLVSVIIIIVSAAFISFKLGITDGVKLALFPIVILAWTIERLSVIWEEEGGEDAIRYVLGTLFVALCVCIPMRNARIQYLMFNFIGFQFIVLGIILIVGNYTGYKFTELLRFKPLSDQIKLYRNGDEIINESIRLNMELKELRRNPENTIKRWEEEIKKDISDSN